MGKAARIKAQRSEEFFHEQKRPTSKYRTAKEQQEQRRRDRKAARKHEALMAKVAASARGEFNG